MGNRLTDSEQEKRLDFLEVAGNAALTKDKRLATEKSKKDLTKEKEKSQKRSKSLLQSQSMIESSK